MTATPITIKAQRIVILTQPFAPNVSTFVCFGYEHADLERLEELLGERLDITVEDVCGTFCSHRTFVVYDVDAPNRHNFGERDDVLIFHATGS